VAGHADRPAAAERGIATQSQNRGGGGVGKILSQTNHRTMALYSGLVYTREQFVGEPVANAAEIAVGGQVDSLRRTTTTSR